MLQIKFTREEFEQLKLEIDEVLEGKYDGLRFHDPSTNDSVTFEVVESTSEEKEHLALVKEALAAGVTLAEIKFIRAFHEAGAGSFKELIDSYIKFHKTYVPKEDEETSDEHSA